MLAYFVLNRGQFNILPSLKKDGTNEHSNNEQEFKKELTESVLTVKLSDFFKNGDINVGDGF